MTETERPVAQKWGKPNKSDWVLREALGQIPKTDSGGKLFACARKLKEVCPPGYTVDNRQLQRWIDKKSWECWIPKVLAEAFDEYLDNETKIVSQTSTVGQSRTLGEPARTEVQAQTVRRSVSTPKDVGIPETAPANATPAAAAAQRFVTLFGGERTCLWIELADVTFHEIIWNSPPQEGQAVKIECETNLRTVKVNAGLHLGIARARFVCESVGAASGRMVAAPIDFQSFEGLKLEIHGTPLRLNGELKASGRPALMLNGLRAEPVFLGSFEESKVGSAFRIRLLVDSRIDFVHVRAADNGEERGKSINRDKVLTHFAKWQKQVPSDVIDMEFFSQLWRIESIGAS